jgi:hypothetical protein
MKLVEQLFEARGADGAVGLDHLEHREDILRHRQPAEDRRFLRQIAEAERRAPVHRQPGDVGTVEQDAALVGLG